MALQKIDVSEVEQGQENQDLSPGISLDLSYVKTYLRVDHDQDDGMIESFVKTAQSSIEAYTSRALGVQAWEFTLNAGFAVARSDEAYLSQSKSRGDQGIEIPRSPFLELIEDPSLETPYGIKSLNDYRLDTSGRTARIHFGPSAQSLMDGTGKIIIRFRAGYTADTLPDALKQATLMLTAQLYERRSAVNDNPGLVGEFDRNLTMLLRPYQVKRLA